VVDHLHHKQMQEKSTLLIMELCISYYSFTF